MSHFATYECNVSNLDFIKAGLGDMGLSYREDVTITDYFGQKRQSRLAVVSEKGKLLPLGWVQNEDSNLDLQADWYKVPFGEKEFTNKIAQHHAKYQVLETCEENRWDVDMDSITTNENGELEIHATQFA
jgi:Protein of unknown function (DUF1257).